jgi:hypothetical protein
MVNSPVMSVNLILILGWKRVNLDLYFYRMGIYPSYNNLSFIVASVKHENIYLQILKNTHSTEKRQVKARENKTA